MLLPMTLLWSPKVSTRMLAPLWRRHSSKQRAGNRRLLRRLLALFAHQQQGHQAVTAGHLLSPGMYRTSSSHIYISNSSLHCSSSLPRCVLYPTAQPADKGQSSTQGSPLPSLQSPGSKSLTVTHLMSFVGDQKPVFALMKHCQVASIKCCDSLINGSFFCGTFAVMRQAAVDANCVTSHASCYRSVSAWSHSRFPSYDLVPMSKQSSYWLTVMQIWGVSSCESLGGRTISAAPQQV